MERNQSCFNLLKELISVSNKGKTPDDPTLIRVLDRQERLEVTVITISQGENVLRIRKAHTEMSFVEMRDDCAWAILLIIFQHGLDGAFKAVLEVTKNG